MLHPATLLLPCILVACAQPAVQQTSPSAEPGIFSSVLPTIDGANDALRRIDRLWQLEYQKSEDLFRYRVVDADPTLTIAAIRGTFIDLGMPVQASEYGNGVVIAENNAPTPLTLSEWKEVVRVENPRLKEFGAWYLGLTDDPQAYLVTVKATVRKVKGNSFILLDYTMDSPKLRRAGLVPSKFAPPLAVQFASLKFWAQLQRRLADLKAPPPRKRSKQEIDA